MPASTPVASLINCLLLRNSRTKQSGITHSALSRTSGSNDAMVPMSCHVMPNSREREKKENLRDNNVFLFQFLGFHMFGLNREGFRRGLLPFTFRIGFLALRWE